MDKTLIVLDSFEYKEKQHLLEEVVCDFCIPVFVYTQYENRITERFQRMKYVGGLFTHMAYWLLSLKYAFSLIKYKNMQSIIFINPIVGIFYAGIARIFHFKQTLTIAGFLFERKKNHFYYNIRKKMVSFCYRQVKNIVVYGQKEIEFYSKEFPAFKDNFRFVQFGKDYNYKIKKDFSYPKKYIASGGRSNRNYETLCEAFSIFRQDMDNYDCLVATRPECVTPAMEKSSVKFVYGIVLNQFGAFVKGSDFFVLPLKNIGLSAGHMAMMEAMSLKVPVIVTDIPAIRDYVDDKHVFFYEADNAKSLCEVMELVSKNRNNKIVKNKIDNAFELYEQQFSFKALLRRIVFVSNKE